ncbi:MAG: hypothetical protein JWQ49_2030 [Edaphobacter sp.]|nr:hypothetical protein [Edaphobacter sp.]
MAKTDQEIIAYAGSFSSRSLAGEGTVLLQWQASGYHIAILFDATEHVVAITHESGNYEEEPNYLRGSAILVVIIIIAVFVAIANG